jgi:hypothetical protein
LARRPRRRRAKRPEMSDRPTPDHQRLLDKLDMEGSTK